jgi:hypothetical protein
MSADNVLIILRNKQNKIAVYDVGFSYIGSQPAWKEKLTKEDSDALTKCIVNSNFYQPVKEFEKGTKIQEVIDFCEKYTQENIVEYGYRSIIVHH